MAAALRITHPSQLSDVTTSLAGLAIDGASDGQEFILALLQPLDDPEILTACRDPDSQTDRVRDGVVYSYNFFAYEILDITSLSTAWRHALLRIAPIHRVTFDITLPQGTEGGFAVRPPDVVKLVCTLATKARMRANRHLRFGLVYDTHYGLSEDELGFLKEQLEALSYYKSHRSDGERNGQSSGG